jgi:predicted exporter
VEPAKTPRERAERAEDLISLLVPDWRPSPQQVLLTIRIVLAIGVLLGILTLAGQPFGITLWDWIKLLVVPAVIAGVGLWFNPSSANGSSRSRSVARKTMRSKPT